MMAAGARKAEAFTRWPGAILLGSVVLLVSLFAPETDRGMWTLWPSGAALLLVFLTRRVFFSLALAALAGVIILQKGPLWSSPVILVNDMLLPSFTRPWRVGAIIFTLVLGGFAALVEWGGGFRRLLTLFTRGAAPEKARTRVLTGGFGLGLVCFFDGLANSMIMGRVLRSLTDGVRISRERLAYLVDSTSSAVACVAFISTWIAFQLALIREQFLLFEYEGSLYATFFQSIPYNAYCLFTLLLVFLSIRFNFLPGPMRKAEQKALTAPLIEPMVGDVLPDGRVSSALIPLGVLVGAILAGFYLWEARPLFPVTPVRIAEAFGSADGPWILLAGALLGTAVALILNRKGEPVSSRLKVFGEGVLNLLGPVCILLGAWMLSGVLAELETRVFLRDLMGDDFPVWLLPALTFLLGAVISFSTGTSWGTMGILMPLALPLAFTLDPSLGPAELQALIAATVGAVFSGAVFGDHCSPISDTTIVSSVASGVTPHAHVITQLPYALIAGVAALIFGFLPAGLGFAPFWGLLAGAVGLFSVAYWGRLALKV